MTPRRMKKNRDLPPNLQLDGRGGFHYLRPTDKKKIRFGTNRKAAIVAAIRANQEFGIYAGAEELLARATSEGNSEVSAMIEKYKRDYLPSLHYSIEHEKTTRSRLDKFGEKFKGRDVHTITVRAAADYIETFPPRSAIATRSALIKFYAWAISRGYTTQNIFEASLTPVYKPKRRRIETKAEFDAIRKHAPEWLQKTMDLALYSLRRESELAIAKFSDVTESGIEFHVAKKKKQGKGRDTRIMIEFAGLGDLEAAVKACRDNVPSPFLIHRIPEQKTTSKEKTHWTQVLPDYIGKAFRKARDESGIYDTIPMQERPAFHDIRSLGATLYKEAGLHQDVIQALLGHEDAATTRVYLDRYELKVDVVKIA